MYNEDLSLKYIIKRIGTQEHKIRFLLSRVLWLTGLCRFLTINLSYGIKIKFYPTSTSTALWFNPKSFDAEGVDFIWDYLSKGDIFVDVGANIGEMTLSAAKKVGDNGRVISIEPHPKIFKFLNKNIELNKFNNIKTYNFAAGDKDEKIKFSDIRSDDQNFISKEGPISLDMKKIDEVDVGSKIDLLKIDTEGYELFVLRGAANDLLKTQAIYFENYEDNFKRYNYQLKDILFFLFKNRFKVFRFEDSNSLQEISVDYISKDCENLLAIKDLNEFKVKKTNFKLNFLQKNDNV